MTSAFDPQTFLNAQISETNERRPPLPVENPGSPDGCYIAVIGEIDPVKNIRTGLIGKGERIGQPWLQVVVPLKIDVPQQLQDGLKLPKQITLSDGVFLDLTPESTSATMVLDNAPGKNRQQKAYRDALGLNQPGQTFSWQMVQGKPVKIKIKHEMYNGVPQERVEAVLKA